MPTNETILILGASARAAAFSALRGGWAPGCADMFADADLQAVAEAQCVADYPRGLLDASRAFPAGPWLYTGGLENHPRLVDRIAGARPLLGNGGSVLRRVRDPLLVRAVLAEAGLPGPRVAARADGLPRDGTWLAKPRRSAGGKDIAPLTASWQASRDSGRWYLQGRIEGQPIAAVYLADGRQAQLVGATEQLTGTVWNAPGEFSYAGSIGPLRLSAAERAICEGIGATLAETFGLRGLFGVDAIRNGEGIWPVEVNPRYPASAEVLERVGGKSLVAAHVAACRGERIDADASDLRHGLAGKLTIYGRREERASQALSESLMSLRGAERLRPLVADVPRPGAALIAGWPLCTVLADGQSRDDVAAALLARRNDVVGLLDERPLLS